MLIACAAGYPLARLTDRAADLPRRLGESYLLGLGVLAVVMFATTGHWSRVVILAVTAVAVAGLVLLCHPERRARDLGGWGPGSVASTSSPTHPGPSLDARDDRRWLSRFLLLLAALTLLGYALWATLAPLHDFDFLIIWGLKARQFFEHGGIDWSFLTNRDYPWSHHDYPILLPLAFDYTAVLHGAWDDRWIGLLYVAFAAALLLIVHSLLREELGALPAAAATLILAPLVATPWPGRADGPLAVFLTAGLLLARRAWRLQTTDGLPAAALLLGLGALTKNEGMTFLVAAAIGLAADRRMPRRTLLRFWPALAVPAPWLVLRAVYTLPTDLAEGDVLPRLAAHLREVGTYVTLLTTYAGGQPLLWAGITLALLLGMRRVVREERIIALACAVQVAFFIGAYLVTPADLTWHVRFSWERLIAQITPLLVVLSFVLLAPLLARARPIPAASTAPPE